MTFPHSPRPDAYDAGPAPCAVAAGRRARADRLHRRRSAAGLRRGQRPASGTGKPKPTNEPTPTDEPTEAPSESDGQGGTAVPVYFAGDGPGGRTVLFREFHRVEGDPLTRGRAARRGRRPARRPRLPDAVAAGRGLLGAAPPTACCSCRSRPTRFTERPDGMSGRDARLALQQLVYTLQGVQQERVPVLIKRGGSDFRLFGLPHRHAAHGSRARCATLNLVNITSPAEGDTVTGDTLKVTGVANSFEASGPCRLLAGGEEVALEGYQAEGWMEDRLFPFEVELPLGRGHRRGRRPVRDRRPQRRRRGQRPARSTPRRSPCSSRQPDRAPGASHCVTIQTRPRRGRVPVTEHADPRGRRRRRRRRAAVRRPLAPARPAVRAARARPGGRRGRRAGRVRRDAREVVAAARPRQGARLPAPGGRQPLPLGAPAPGRRRAARPHVAGRRGRRRRAGPRRRAPRRRTVGAAPALGAPARGARAAPLPGLVRGADRRRAGHLAAARSRHTHTAAAPPCASCSATGGRTSHDRPSRSRTCSTRSPTASSPATALDAIRARDRRTSTPAGAGGPPAASGWSPPRW